MSAVVVIKARWCPAGRGAGHHDDIEIICRRAAIILFAVIDFIRALSLIDAAPASFERRHRSPRHFGRQSARAVFYRKQIVLRRRKIIAMPCAGDVRLRGAIVKRRRSDDGSQYGYIARHHDRQCRRGECRPAGRPGACGLSRHSPCTHAAIMPVTPCRREQ